MVHNFHKIYQNLDRINQQCSELNDYGVQVLKDLCTGNKFYYKPVCIDQEAISFGFFFTNRDGIDEFNSIWNCCSNPDLVSDLRKRDKSNSLVKAAIESPIELVVCETIFENGDEFLLPDYFGKGSDIQEIRSDRFDDVLAFLSSPSIIQFNYHDTISPDLKRELI